MESKITGAFNAALNALKGATKSSPGGVSAVLNHISSTPVPRVHHSLSVVKGRAYIFGGESSPGKLENNDMQVVILPSSGVLEADYQSLKARPYEANGPMPRARKGHSSVVVGDDIYVIGGEDENGAAVDETRGLVWVFHTASNSWERLEPASPDAQAPPPRVWAALTSSEEPGPRETPQASSTYAPQKPPDPATVVPEPPASATWGTLFVVGGISTSSPKPDTESPETRTEPVSDNGILSDAWAFDIRTRAWSSLPPVPASAGKGASIALLGHHLYLYGSPASSLSTTNSHTFQWLDVGSVWKHAEAGTSALQSGWTWNQIQSQGESVPPARSGAHLAHVKSGPWRDWLLLIGGEGVDSYYLNDIWAVQFPGSSQVQSVAGAIKDTIARRTSITTSNTAAATAIGGVGGVGGGGGGNGAADHPVEAVWKEVQYRYVNAEGDVTDVNTAAPGTKGMGPRGNFAAAQGTEVDGASVLIWGGVGQDREVILSDGWMISI